MDADKSKLNGPVGEVEKQLRAKLKAHPNLVDYVKARMAATGHNASVTAANSSTIFATFNVDAATGKAQLKDPGDPDVGGSKLGYLRTGLEPQGALRAALECCADPAIGIASTSAEIRKRVIALVGTHEQGLASIRLGFQLALPHAGNVDVAKLADLSHRVSIWGDLDASTPAQRLADSVRANEAKTVFDALLALGRGDDVDADIHQAWMKYDPTHAAAMMTKLSTSGMTVETFKQQLSRAIVDSHLATMLPISGMPTTGQMLLALTIADANDALPAVVRDFLRAAAGGGGARQLSGRAWCRDTASERRRSHLGAHRT